MKTKHLGSRGSMVAKLKLKGFGLGSHIFSGAVKKSSYTIIFNFFLLICSILSPNYNLDVKSDSKIIWKEGIQIGSHKKCANFG